MKQAIVVRNDLKMHKGKIAAQASHASLESYKRSDKDKILEWESGGYKKIVLKVQSEEELLELYQEAKKMGVVCALITDAGHTQVEPNTRTCVGIGPDCDEIVDRLTGHLKLL